MCRKNIKDWLVMVSLVKVASMALKAYGYSTMSQRTGMSIAEIMLYKDVAKACNKYYSQKFSIFAKSVFGKG